MSIEKKLLHYMGLAIEHYRLIQADNRILVGVSGGKDSLTLLWLLRLMQQRAKIKFDLQVGIVDFNFFSFEPLIAWLKDQSIEYKILKATINFGSEDKKTPCVLCSRLRRGMLYSYARENNFNKLALGHHRDDVNSSLLMSIFYNGKIASMPPKWRAEGITVIRPLFYCQERDIEQYAKQKEFPLSDSTCPLAKNEGSRERVNNWLKPILASNPKIGSNLLRATQNLRPEHLADRQWWNFEEG